MKDDPVWQQIDPVKGRVKVIRDFPKIQKQEIQLNELINWFGD